MEYFEHMAIIMFLTLLKSIVKNPQKAEHLKADLIAARDAINALYPDQGGVLP